MNHRRVRFLWLGALGLPLALVALLSLAWPGPIALDDRVPLVLLFGVPAVVLADRLRRELA